MQAIGQSVSFIAKKVIKWLIFTMIWANKYGPSAMEQGLHFCRTNHKGAANQNFNTLASYIVTGR